MKLKNLILTIGAMAFCSAAFADNTSMMAKGGTYVGLAGGWGTLVTDNQALSYIDFEYGNGQIKSSGGFAGRVYLGYLMPTSGAWLFGPEVSYSYYSNNTYFFEDSDDSSVDLKQSGYGIDLLFNATYMLTNTVNVAIKPGFQYAFETYNSDPQSWEGSASKTSQILPEVNLEVNWQVSQSMPLFVGASYQCVFGNGTNNVGEYDNGGTLNVSSRDMVTLNLEYLF